MTRTQIYSLLNAVTNESVGGTAITVKDTSTFISLGDQILSTAANVEQFYQKLADRIGKTIIEAKVYIPEEFDDIIKGDMEFGAALQKIRVKKIARAKENQTYHTNSQGRYETVNPFDVIKRDDTEIIQQIFSKQGVFEIDKLTYDDRQLKSAFTNETTFGAFVSLIFQDMTNGMSLKIEELNRLTIVTSIAEALNHGGKMKVNLLSAYNTLTGEQLTATTALSDAGFLKYASMTINQTIKLMRSLSNLWNSQGVENQTTADELSVRVITDLAASQAAYLESDTYHKELISLPSYKEVNYWQGVGTDGSFGARSKVFITLDDDTEVENSYVLATVFDKKRVGTMVNHVRTRSIYNPASEASSFFHKADWGSYVDTTYNCVVFTMA